jgi:hypothetical protein
MPAAADRAETWVLESSRLQFIEGKTAGPLSYLAARTPWIPVGSEMTQIMECPTHGTLEARVRPAQAPGMHEVLAKILTGRARTALYVRVKAEPGARTVSRIVSGFDRPDVYVAVRVKP